MIIRTWSARATETGADQYRAYFEQTLLPQLRELPGFCGGYLLSRDAAGLVELTTHTLWDSPEAIRAFAGEDTAAAIVEPQARAFLRESDPTVVHRTVVAGTHG
jgi:heme-degrading monooxygenase HmoA